MYVARARAWQSAGEWDKSLADFDEAIRLDPGNAEAFVGRANTWRLKGEYDKSLDDFSTALDVYPEWTTALNGRAWIRATCWKETFRHAEKALEDANQAGELTDWSDFEVLNTLAAAIARYFFNGLVDRSTCATDHGSFQRAVVLVAVLPYRRDFTPVHPFVMTSALSGSRSAEAPRGARQTEIFSQPFCRARRSNRPLRHQWTRDL